MIWFLYIFADAVANWYVIEKKKVRPVYLVLFFIRGIAAILYGAFVMDVEATSASFFHWLFSVTLPFPFLFDTTLNVLRKKDLDYMGASSGYIDTFVVRHHLQRAWLAVSWVMFLISLTLIA